MQMMIMMMSTKTKSNKDDEYGKTLLVTAN